MAQISQFGKPQKRGWRIGSLPMPDGSRRTYKEFGRDAFAIIINKWKAEVAEMKLSLDRQEA